MKKSLKNTTRLTLALGLVAQGLLLSAAPAASAQRRSAPAKVAPAAVQESEQLPGKPVTAVTKAVVDMDKLSRQQARTLIRPGVMTPKLIHAPLTIDDSSSVDGQTDTTPKPDGDISTPGEPADQGGPNVPGPSPSLNYQGEFDEAKGGGPSGTFTIPPDTMGAVGLTKVVVHVNNNYIVQDKATGARLSVVSMDAFWASTGATGLFDPRVVYDPYNNIFLVSGVSNAQTANSSVLFGYSNSSDPSGTWTLFRVIVGCAPGAVGCNAQGEWADFPMLGFNKNWVAIGWNQFTINTGAFVAGKMLVIDYPVLRTGTANATLFSNASAATGFCMHPATTFSTSENTLYVPTHQQSGGALYRLHTITGTPAAPVFALDGTARVRPGGGWTQPGGDNLPQTCVGTPGVTCPTTLRGIDTGDSFIRSNAVFRNGKIWYPQTIALPAGGIVAATRFVAQWTALNPDGTFFDGGRVEDPTATRTNGGEHYAYPSIAVNKNNDVLFGFSNFESDDFADAGYTFRLGTDPAGTMRDPVIYKEGEDYYSKAFSGTRNRWGDYSHSVVDPSNDADLWTLQEYAGMRTVQDANTTTNNSRWATWWAKISVPASAGDLLISEFRLRGPNPNDTQNEFIEIYNPSSSNLTVSVGDGSAGYAVAASDGVIRCTIPNGTVIPGRGHYLCVNSVGYSLASYPAGNGTTATGDATYTTDIADNAGIALFNTATVANFATGTRLDAVGSTSEANTLYKEGTGYPAITPFSIDHSFYRKVAGSGPCTTGPPTCTSPTGTTPVDTDNNATDFFFVDTNGTSAGAGQRLGAPGPENLSSPIPNLIPPSSVVMLDATVGSGIAPNRVRDLTSDPANNSTFGTLSIRRRVINNTGGNVTRLRFRITDVSTFPAPAGTADLRSRTSALIVVSGINDPATCPGGITPCVVNVQGTTLEQPPSQPNGGGYNSSWSAGTITLATPLAAGASVNVQFLLGVQQTGTFKVFIIVEALP